MPSTTQEEYFERDCVWGDSYWTDVQQERARITCALLPTGTGSVVDVGCGAGVVTRELGKSVGRVLGLDLGFRPLSQLRRAGLAAVQANVQALPLADGSFDAVLASEVLEHLQEAERARALDELARVARSHILVTVPYREPLEDAQLKCGSCGCVFHAWGHTHSFTEEQMAALFGSSFRLVRLAPFGTGRKRVPGVLLRLAHRFDGYMVAQPGRFLCPRCGQSERFVSRRWATRLFRSLPQRILPLPQRCRWMAALYHRNGPQGRCVSSQQDGPRR